MAVQTYLYPTLKEVNDIDQQLMAQAISNSRVLQLFPMIEKPTSRVAWRQRDNYLGLTQIRGYNAPPPGVPRVGMSEYVKEPSAFGEFTQVDEKELTDRAIAGRPDIPVPIDDLVMECDEMLVTRQTSRIEWLIWQLLIYGYYHVTSASGTVIDRDSYAPQTFTSTVPWSTVATATPLADFRAVRLLSRGSSVSFGTDALALMNQVTFDHMIGNTLATDLGGRRDGLDLIMGLESTNKLNMKDGLPKVEIYDQGYYTDAGVWTQWIPDNYVVVIGKRKNGAEIGNFILTKNASNPDFGSRPFSSVIDTGRLPGFRPPRMIEVHRGFNGGTAIYYPGSVVVMRVGT